MEIIKQEQALPVLRQPASGELQQALESVLIRQATLEQIKEALRLVMIKIGLRAQNWPTDEEKLVLIEHIVTAFGGHTIREIKLAFDMAIAGRLETTNNKDEIVTLDPNCYENFSCLYFSNIMNAYRRWAKNEVKQLPNQFNPKIEQALQLVEKMTDNEFIEMNFKTWQVLKNPGIISTKCYGMLVAQGKINLTQAQKDEMYRLTEIKLIARIGVEKEACHAKRVYDHELLTIYSSPNKNHWKARVFNECKKLAVENYFKGL